MNFKENLKQLRIKKNLTQENISQMLCIGIKAYQAWEQGIREPRELQTLEQLTIILDCDYNALLK